LFEGKVIYDKTYGHAAYGCANCRGTMQTQLWFDPLGVPFDSTAGQGVNGYDNCAQTWNDMSNYFYNDWSTQNTAIATVDTYGTHTGVSSGSTTSDTWANLREGSNGLYCPRQRFTLSGNTNVQKPYFFKVVSSSTTSDTSCNLFCKVLLQYKVLDVNSQPITIPGMIIAESLSGASGTCTVNFVDSSTWNADSTGTMVGSDGVGPICCAAGSTCSKSVNQSFTVNGFPVLIMGQDGITTGTHNAITDTCNNGQADCARIVITP
jgi:hypothetical protein